MDQVQKDTIKLNQNNKSEERLSITMPKKVKDKLTVLANKDRRKLANMVKFILTNYKTGSKLNLYTYTKDLDKKKEVVTIRLPSPLWEVIAKEANTEYVSVAAKISLIVEDYVKRHK